MPIKSVSSLFVHDISDPCSAESQVARSLVKMTESATDPGLKEATATDSKLGVVAKASQRQQGAAK